ncbi:MAG: hypothetical protein GX889_03085 [Clostridiales bacterium]|nr:hypothetical protein [Clostridiales bacterium]
MKNERTYWNEEGLYQEEVNKLEDLKPDRGYTNNEYMNLFLAVSHLYYDVYNNGGCNIKDFYMKDIEKYIKPFIDEIKSINLNVKPNTLLRNLKNLEKLEEFINETILFIKDKDLSYDKYIIFYDYDNEQLSKKEIKGFRKITFGNKEDYNEWVNNRINSWNYKMIG